MKYMLKLEAVKNKVVVNFIITSSDTSPNKQKELNHWAVQLILTWDQAGKSCVLFIYCTFVNDIRFA